jgi:uncharacterized protein
MKSGDIFNCTQCGDCCKGYGGTFLAEEDVRTIADYIHEDPESFIGNYCEMSGGRPVLAQGDNGYCIFWDEVCAIHPVKPRMCREWPFIKSVLIDPKNWHIMGSLCPGIRTDVPDSVIRRCVEETILIDEEKIKPDAET